MTKTRVTPTGRESPFIESEIIVSKTDLKGRITYVNDVFVRVSGYAAHELIGQPHSMIRHPAMPRCVFKLLWDTLEAKEEIFAYVLNMAKNGDHYWVFAHITPTLNAAGTVVGYHSNRRKPDPAQIAKIEPLYKILLDDEKRAKDRKIGMRASGDHLTKMLTDGGVRYDEFVFAL